MLYYGLLDPVTDIRIVHVEHRWVDVYIDLDRRPVAGSLRVELVQLFPVLRLFCGKMPVAERDENDLVHWSADYSKRVVVSEDGTLEPTENLV